MSLGFRNHPTGKSGQYFWEANSCICIMYISPRPYEVATPLSPIRYPPPYEGLLCSTLRGAVRRRANRWPIPFEQELESSKKPIPIRRSENPSVLGARGRVGASSVLSRQSSEGSPSEILLNYSFFPLASDYFLVPLVGGVNHCHSHCRLAKFRGLMYGGKYSAVIGLK